MDDTPTLPPLKVMRMEEEHEAPVKEEHAATILDLPPEILVYILSFLDVHTLLLGVVVVCRRWREAVIGDALWHHFRHLTLERRKTPLPLRSLIQRCSNLVQLEIRAKECWPKRSINAAVFDAIASCRRLRSLSVKHFLIHSDCAGPIQRCLAALPLLETLDLSFCKLVDEVGSALAEALAGSPRLKALYLVGHSSASTKTLTAVIARCPPLQRLDLSACNLSLDADSLGAVLGAHSCTLSSLNLSGNAVFERDLAPLEDCSGLSALKVDCTDLTDQTLLRLRRLPLRELDLHSGFGFTPDGLETFFQEADVTQLESLNVHGCSMLGDGALRAVSLRCPALRVLRAGSCPRVTDEGVRHVVRRCPNLIVVVLRGLKSLHGEFLEEAHHRLENLKLIDLAFCDGVDGQHLRLFLELGAPRFRVEEVPHYAVPYCGSSIDAHRCFIDLDTVAQSTFRPVMLISRSMSPKLIGP